MSNETVLIVIYAAVLSPIVFGVMAAVYSVYSQKDIEYASAYKVIHENGMCYVYEICPTSVDFIGMCASGKSENREIENLIDQNESLKGE